MDEHLAWEIASIIKKELLQQIIDEAKHIDSSKFTRVRFVLEFNIDPVRQLVTDAGIETRYRRELRK